MNCRCWSSILLAAQWKMMEVLACKCLFSRWKVDRLTGAIMTSGSGPRGETQVLNKWEWQWAYLKVLSSILSWCQVNTITWCK